VGNQPGHSVYIPFAMELYKDQSSFPILTVHELRGLVWLDWTVAHEAVTVSNLEMSLQESIDIQTEILDPNAYPT
jgi:hypothetical protein